MRGPGTAGPHERSSSAGYGDVLGDDGVVFIASDQAGEVLATARQIAQAERDQAPRKIQAGQTLRRQTTFGEYLTRHAADPSYTFRRHLRQIGRAIEEQASRDQQRQRVKNTHNAPTRSAASCPSSSEQFVTAPAGSTGGRLRDIPPKDHDAPDQPDLHRGHVLAAPNPRQEIVTSARACLALNGTHS